ncbi:MAG: methylated-DNA--[protein]-cysteine S-methyltransferase [Actinomycetota bacterium]|nr:methylated-DNA--[protein]-cysteine S-methyltransferase [Actinomycetota bacterium]
MTGPRCRTVDSPVGPLTLAGDEGALTHLVMQNQTHLPPGRHRWRPDRAAFAEVVAQLEDYFAGTRRHFDAVTFRLDGTAFQQRVWRALLEIPYGETRSYGALAAQIGQPGAARAIGLANGRNPIGIIVPCHRVVGAGGALTGYGGGLHRKRALLDLEQGPRPGPS